MDNQAASLIVSELKNISQMLHHIVVALQVMIGQQKK
jgi:hypothetical protein